MSLSHVIPESVKSRLKKIFWLYRQVYFWRRRQQDREIQDEQNRCERKARERGILVGEEPAKAVFERLQRRLAARGAAWPPHPHGRPLHIVYASVPGGWERHNIPPELERLGKVSCFFLDQQGIELGAGWGAVRREVDRRLPSFMKSLHAQSPVDLFLSYLSGSQISPSTIEQVAGMGIPLFSFHLDDRRSFYGRRYDGQWSGPAAVCRAYDLNLTNAPASLVKYRVEGGDVLFWPEGANPDFFRPLDLPFLYDVSFCGERYGVRPILVESLRRRGLRISCFGRGWENGYQGAEDLVKIINQSRINLGMGYVNESGDQCLKGRDFEIPACGAVYLTSENADLRRVYRVGVEIETYRDFDDCAVKIKALLADESRCDAYRRASRTAVLERHTWKGRVDQLISCQGVPPPPL